MITARMTIRVRQHGVKPLGEHAAPYRFYVDVVDEIGQPAFREHHVGRLRTEVIDWCSENCSRPALIGGLEMVCFQNEDDALLFYLSFKV